MFLFLLAFFVRSDEIADQLELLHQETLNLAKEVANLKSLLDLQLAQPLKQHTQEEPNLLLLPGLVVPRPITQISKFFENGKYPGYGRSYRSMIRQSRRNFMRSNDFFLPEVYVPGDYDHGSLPLGSTYNYSRRAENWSPKIFFAFRPRFNSKAAY